MKYLPLPVSKTHGNGIVLAQRGQDFTQMLLARIVRGRARLVAASGLPLVSCQKGLLSILAPLWTAWLKGILALRISDAGEKNEAGVAFSF
jgi:hypothetical protein